MLAGSGGQRALGLWGCSLQLAEKACGFTPHCPLVVRAQGRIHAPTPPQITSQQLCSSGSAACSHLGGASAWNILESPCMPHELFASPGTCAECSGSQRKRTLPGEVRKASWKRQLPLSLEVEEGRTGGGRERVEGEGRVWGGCGFPGLMGGRGGLGAGRFGGLTAGRGPAGSRGHPTRGSPPGGLCSPSASPRPGRRAAVSV